MRRLILLLPAACLLAACAPQYVTAPVTPIVRQISPQEAAAIVIDATNTAAAISTQVAQATATDISARATSTTSALQTQDSVAVAQTRAALALTSQAGSGMATDAAAVRTQQAGQTATWAAPTAVALAQAGRATGTAQARQDAQAVSDYQIGRAVADARGWLLLVVAVLFLLGLGGAVVFGVSDLFSARAEKLRASAARDNAVAMQMWIMQYGGHLLQLRDNGGWEIMHTPQLAAPMQDIAAAGHSPVREVPYRVSGEVVSQLRPDPIETPERLRVLHLLNQAISIAGPNAGFIPSAERLGMHPQDWQLAVDKLKAGPDRPAYVQTRTGRPRAGQAGGTRLCQPAYMTLGALRDGVKRGDVLPRPGDQAAEVVAGNIHNVSFEAS